MDDDKKAPTPPEEHRFEGELRVCDPEKLDRSDEIDNGRVGRISEEFRNGFETLRKYKLAATFFGSARYDINDQVCSETTKLASMLAKSGFAIITGGAGGVMEAANRGAYDAGGQSVGLNIELPEEQGSNQFLTESQTFNYFFARKVMLSFASEVYIYFPGGFGTLDELFEILTLVQTKKIKEVPIVLYGKAYWEPIVALMKDHLLDTYKTISPEDLDLFTVVDSVDEAYEAILDLVRC